VLDTPKGRLAVAISWEVFFGRRVRAGVRAGATLVLNPTNGSSYTGTILQSQQVTSSRLRAIETDRWVVQAAPTGFSAFVQPDGTVLNRTSVSERRVITRTVGLRTGRTWYVRFGDAPLLVLTTVALLATWRKWVVATARRARLRDRR
jgi:apolipoprotein N-acyltransferase